MKLLHNAYIHTQNPSQPTASALLIDREQIIMVGEADVLLNEFPRAEKQDMDGRIILPGLTDAHLHLKYYSLSLQKIDCETDTKEECLHRVAERVKKTKPGEWILGHGWNQNVWGEWLTASELDRIAPNNPVYLTAKSLHAGLVNTPAMKLASITSQTPDPHNGSLQRDTQGNITGVLLETAMELVGKVIPDPTINEIAEAIEKAHVFACKRYLNISANTPNKFVYGDLGRFPMYVVAAIRCVKFWLRILALPEDRLPKKAYKMLHHLESTGKKSWAYHVKELLFRNGFGYVWLQQGVGSVNVFLALFKRRLIDQYQQDWSSAVGTSERYEFYALFKRSFGVEKYLDTIQFRRYRESLIRFRFGMSPIRVHKLRYKRNVLPRHLLCPACKLAVESEIHILLHCAAYNAYRRDVAALAPALDNTFVSLKAVMAADDETSLVQLARFLYKVFRQRKQFYPE